MTAVEVCGSRVVRVVVRVVVDGSGLNKTVAIPVIITNRTTMIMRAVLLLILSPRNSEYVMFSPEKVGGLFALFLRFV